MPFRVLHNSSKQQDFHTKSIGLNFKQGGIKIQTGWSEWKTITESGFQTGWSKFKHGKLRKFVQTGQAALLKGLWRTLVIYWSSRTNPISWVALIHTQQVQNPQPMLCFFIVVA
jgi:hypothetical protein